MALHQDLIGVCQARVSYDPHLDPDSAGLLFSLDKRVDQDQIARVRPER